MLALCGRLGDVDGARVASYIASMQLPDGSFQGDVWGEVDTRFSYCAVSALALLGRLDAIDADAAAGYIVRCANPDGGFGVSPGAESHAGMVCGGGWMCVCARARVRASRLRTRAAAAAACVCGGVPSK